MIKREIKTYNQIRKAKNANFFAAQYLIDDDTLTEIYDWLQPNGNKVVGTSDSILFYTGEELKKSIAAQTRKPINKVSVSSDSYDIVVIPFPYSNTGGYSGYSGGGGSDSDSSPSYSGGSSNNNNNNNNNNNG